MENYLITEKSVGDLLTGGFYEIPTHQRPYTWGPGEALKLLNDIDEWRKRPQDVYGEHYFLRLISWSEVDGKRVLQDGQQRIVTLFLARAAFSKVLSAHSDIDSDLLSLLRGGVKSREGAKLTGKVKLRVVDQFESSNDVLKAIVNHALDGDALPSRPESRYRVVFKEILKWCETFVTERGLEEFAEFVFYATDKCKVAVHRVPSEEAGWKIFELANDRGVDIAAADLLKNKLFGKTDAANQDTMTSTWNKMVSDSREQNLNFDKTLAAALTSLYGNSASGLWSPKNLHNKFGKVSRLDEISGDQITKVIAARFRHVDELNRGLRSGNTISSLRVLNALDTGSNSAAIQLLAAGATIEDETAFAKLTEALTGLWFVHSVSKEYPTRFHDFVKDSLDAVRGLRSLDDVEAFITGVVKPKLKTYEDEFEAWCMTTIHDDNDTQKKHVRYLLGLIDSNLRGTQGASEFTSRYLGQDAIEAEATLEHIAPKKGRNSDEVTQLVHALGNLTLLGRQENTKAGTRPFVEKHEIFESSTFKVTQALAKDVSNNRLLFTQPAAWNAGTIRKRQVELYRAACILLGLKINPYAAVKAADYEHAEPDRPASGSEADRELVNCVKTLHPVPQADNVEMIRLYAGLVRRNTGKDAVKARFKEAGYKDRQVTYYKDACLAYGFVSEDSNGVLTSTRDWEEATEFDVAVQVLRSDVMKVAGDKSQSELKEMLAKHTTQPDGTKYSGSTMTRRTKSICSIRDWAQAVHGAKQAAAEQ